MFFERPACAFCLSILPQHPHYPLIRPYIPYDAWRWILSKPHIPPYIPPYIPTARASSNRTQTAPLYMPLYTTLYIPTHNIVYEGGVGMLGDVYMTAVTGKHQVTYEACHDDDPIMAYQLRLLAFDLNKLPSRLSDTEKLVTYSSPHSTTLHSTLLDPFCI